MKNIPLTIVESYVSHWGYWQGVRELLQNAVDTHDYDIVFGEDNILIISRGGKIPVSALLMGKSSKRDDETTIGKFGEGMKLGLLVLKRLGANIYIQNHDERWIPTFEVNDLFEEKCLNIQIIPQEDTRCVQVFIGNIPPEAIKEIKENFAPARDLKVVAETSQGKAFTKKNEGADARIYVKGIFVGIAKGNYKYDYDFRPEILELDRDRNSVNSWDVQWEATRLFTEAGEILLLAELAASRYDDIEHFGSIYSNRFSDRDRETLESHAVRIFYETYGNNAWPINQGWPTSRKNLITYKLIQKGFVPTEVSNALYTMFRDYFHIDSELEAIIDFKPIEFIENFISKYSRQMRAKPLNKLKKVLEDLKILKGEK